MLSLSKHLLYSLTFRPFDKLRVTQPWEPFRLASTMGRLMELIEIVTSSVEKPRHNLNSDARVRKSRRNRY